METVELANVEDADPVPGGAEKDVVFVLVKELDEVDELETSVVRIDEDVPVPNVALEDELFKEAAVLLGKVPVDSPVWAKEVPASSTGRRRVNMLRGNVKDVKAREAASTKRSHQGARREYTHASTLSFTVQYFARYSCHACTTTHNPPP